MVLTFVEVSRLLGKLSDEKWLMASLLYGAGLRLLECLRLRGKSTSLLHWTESTQTGLFPDSFNFRFGELEAL